VVVVVVAAKQGFMVMEVYIWFHYLQPHHPVSP